MTCWRVRSAVAIWTLLLLVSGASAVGRGAPRHTTGTNEGKIAFSCTRNKNTDIYERAVIGNALKRFTTDSHQDIEPAWSPSGRSLAFVSYRRSGNADVWVTSARGRSPHDLTPERGSQSMPAWSPDGSEIVYASSGPGVTDPGLWIVDADGTNPHAIPHTASASSPSWSPTGRRIVFTSAASGYSLSTIAPDGSARTRITTPRDTGTRITEDIDPAWSPRGIWIAFSRLRGFRPASSRTLSRATIELFLVRHTGRGLRRVTSDRATDATPDWSPNARKVIYAQRPSIGSGLDTPTGLRIVHLGSGRGRWFLRGMCDHPSWTRG